MSCMTTQSGKSVVASSTKNTFLKLKFVSNMMPLTFDFQRNFLVQACEWKIKNWNNTHQQRFKSTEINKEYLIMFALTKLNKVFTIDCRKRKKNNIVFKKKIESVCNYKNILYLYSRRNVTLLDLSSGEIFKECILNISLLDKIKTKIDISYDGNLLFILNKSLLVIQNKSGLALKEISKKINIYCFFAACSKNFLLIGERENNIDFWALRNDKFYSVSTKKCSIRKRCKINFVIKKNELFYLTVTKKNMVFFFFFYKITNKSKTRIFRKFLMTVEIIDRFDLVKNNFQVIILLCSLDKIYSINLNGIREIKLAKDFQITRTAQKKKLTNKQTFKNDRFSSTKRVRSYIMKNIIKSSSKKQEYFKNRMIELRIKYKMSLERKIKNHLLEQNFLSNLKFFFQHKDFIKNSSKVNLLKHREYFNLLTFFRTISIHSFLNLFLKKFYLTGEFLHTFLFWLKELLNNHFTFITRSKFLHQNLQIIRSFLPNLENHSSFLMFSAQTNILLNEILVLEFKSKIKI